MTGFKLQDVIVKKYGTVAKFAIIVKEDYGKIMRDLYKDDIAWIEKLVEQTPNVEVDREMNKDLLRKLREAIADRGGATKFVKDSNKKYTKSTVDDILSGKRYFISKTIKELLYDLGIWERESTSL